jgi:microcystin-dependent protein
MSNPYLGEIRMFAGNFAPRGWALCNGQTLAISQNTALFSLLGTTYGGNGTTTFNLPNLQGRVPIHMGTSTLGSSWIEGQVGGAENVSIVQNNLPAHNHQINCINSGGTQASPVGGYPAVESTGTSYNYATGTANGTLIATTVSNTGSNVPLNVVNPYLVVNFIIALVGIFPSRN